MTYNVFGGTLNLTHFTQPSVGKRCSATAINFSTPYLSLKSFGQGTSHSGWRLI